MKIGIITDSIRDKSTGIGFYSRDIAEAILEYYPNNEYYFIDYEETNFNRSNLLTIPNPFSKFKTYMWHNYMPFKFRDKQMDIVFNFSAVPHFFPMKQKEIFFVYDISWYLYPEYHPKSRVLFYKAFFRQCLKNSYRIVTDSNSAKDDLIKYFSISKDKISVIYPSVPKIRISNKKLQMKINEPYLLFIGTLEPRKNIISIIKAFSIFKATHKTNHKLIICGKKGWLYDDIFKLIRTSKLDSEIKYFGYITDEEKKYLYQNAESFIYPSNYEGFGIPVIEALSFGCPVITSNISSLPEAIGEAGIQVDPQRIDEIVIAFEEMLFKRRKRSKFIKAGYKHLQTISNKKQITELFKKNL